MILKSRGQKYLPRAMKSQDYQDRCNPDLDAYICRHTPEEFLEVSVRVSPKLKIAHVIGKAVWRQRADIRDVISIGKLVRKNDGPEEVEQILSTMTKYGETKEH
jgi:hypothetical protein